MRARHANEDSSVEGLICFDSPDSNEWRFSDRTVRAANSTANLNGTRTYPLGCQTNKHQAIFPRIIYGIWKTWGLCSEYHTNGHYTSVHSNVHTVACFIHVQSSKIPQALVSVDLYGPWPPDRPMPRYHALECGGMLSHLLAEAVTAEGNREQDSRRQPVDATRIHQRR